jgi:galactose mutarotase-like enzyme
VRIVTLSDPSSDVAAQFVPEAGMIGVSLTDSGVELLGQRRGLDAYVNDGKTMGIPLLYPWANRLGANTYQAAGKTVTLTDSEFGVRTDSNGLPIHGVLAAYPNWRVTHESDHQLTGEVDFTTDEELLASFPFPHRLSLTITLAERTLRLRVAVTPTGEYAVPLCFGFHPYLQLPDVPRDQWVIETPAMQHLTLDRKGLPTGTAVVQPALNEPLGDKIFDDGYNQVAEGSTFAVSGGGRRIEVHFDEGYSAAQIFAPPGEDVVCFEPMTAPTDALRRGGYPSARPGDWGIAQFSIQV